MLKKQAKLTFSELHLADPARLVVVGDDDHSFGVHGHLRTAASAGSAEHQLAVFPHSRLLKKLILQKEPVSTLSYSFD